MPRRRHRHQLPRQPDPLRGYTVACYAPDGTPILRQIGWTAEREMAWRAAINQVLRDLRKEA